MQRLSALIAIAIAVAAGTAPATAAVKIKSSQQSAPPGVAPLTAAQKAAMLGAAGARLRAQRQTLKAKAVESRQKRMALDATHRERAFKAQNASALEIRPYSARIATYGLATSKQLIALVQRQKVDVEGGSPQRMAIKGCNLTMGYHDATRVYVSLSEVSDVYFGPGSIVLKSIPRNGIVKTALGASGYLAIYFEPSQKVSVFVDLFRRVINGCKTHSAVVSMPNKYGVVSAHW